jgi:hypothetical protein
MGKNLVPIGVRFPDRAACGESLYRLHYLEINMGPYENKAGVLTAEPWRSFIPGWVSPCLLLMYFG